MNTIGSLAHEVGVSERTLRRGVNRGTLHASRPTPRKLELPLSEREYVRRSWSLISKLQSALRTEPNVPFALLFGSAATGVDTVDSDIDLLVNLRDTDLQRVVDLTAKLARVVGRTIDIIDLADAETDPTLLAEIVTGGRVLVDREELWPQLQARASRLRRRGRAQDAKRLDGALAGIDRLLAS